MQNEFALSYHKVRGLYFLVVTSASTIVNLLRKKLNALYMHYHVINVSTVYVVGYLHLTLAYCKRNDLEYLLFCIICKVKDAKQFHYFEPLTLFTNEYISSMHSN